MKKMLGGLVILVAISGFSAERGTPAEAKALLAKAVAHYKAVGQAQALADFNRKKSPFIDRDLYVFCVNSKGIIQANGGFPYLVGTSADAVKDAKGRSIGKLGWQIASTRGSGSIEYRWINPVTHKTEPKISFFQRVAPDIACGVGAYNPR